MTSFLLTFTNCSSDSSGGDGNNGGFGTGDNKGGNAAGQVNIAGTWTGTGSIIVSDNQTFQCNNVTFEFNQSDNQIEVVRGDYTCEQNVSYQWNPITVELNGNKVLFQSQEIGTINGSAITIEEGTDSLTIEKSGTNALNIRENKTENGNSILVNAQLTKQ